MITGTVSLITFSARPLRFGLCAFLRCAESHWTDEVIKITAKNNRTVSPLGQTVRFLVGLNSLRV